MTAVRHGATNSSALKYRQLWLSSGIVRLFKKEEATSPSSIPPYEFEEHKHRHNTAVAFNFPTIILSVPTGNMITYLIFHQVSEIKYVSIETVCNHT